MARFVALLRGINVGGHRKVPMAALRDLCGALGYEGAATHVQSGNLVFGARGTAGTIASRLEAGIGERFGFPVDVVVRPGRRWERYLRENPFPEASEEDPGRVLLFLTREPPRKAGARDLAARGTAGERVELRGDGVWIHFPAGVARTRLSPALIDRLLGSPATGRNWRTVRAIGAMLAGTP